MIDKKQFIEIMEELRHYQEAQLKICLWMELLDEDFWWFSISWPLWLITKTLSLAVDDKRDWINYFMYDCNWWEKSLNVVVNWKRFKLKTLSKLYDIITNTNEWKK